MQVKIQGIGGIIDPVEYEFVKGVNVFRAPNAWGKTSLAKGLLSLMTSSIKGEDLINVNADKSYIVADLGGKKYYRKISVKPRTGKVVEESKLILDDPRVPLLAYFSPENPLVNKILSGEEDITWFVLEVAEIAKLKARKDELAREQAATVQDIEALKSTYARVKEIKSRLERVYSEIDQLKQNKADISRKVLETIEISKRNRAEALKSRLEVKKAMRAQLEEKLRKLKEELDRINAELSNQGIEAITSKLEKIDAELKEISSKKGELEGKLKSLQILSDEAREAERAHSDHCPLCGSKVDADFWRHRIETIIAEIRKYSDSMKALAEREAELVTKKKELEMLLRDSQKKVEERTRIINEINKLQKEIADLDYQIRDLETQIKTNEEKMRKEVPNTEKLSESAIESRLNELEEERKRLEYELQEYPPETTILEEIQRKNERLREIKEELSNLDQELTRRITTAVTTFNEELSKLIRNLEFDFTAKVILDNSRIKLKVFKGNAELGVRRLSTSEKTSLALALIASAIKTFFAPPIVILDESVMAYDENRFKKVVEYLAQLSSYVIVTRADVNLALESQMVSTAQQA
jgi:DNA repair exonuclease SbcCD ATPase subunit